MSIVNIYISYVVMEGKHPYSKIATSSIKSLLNCGFPEENVILLMIGKKIFNNLSCRFTKSINIKISEKLPRHLKKWFVKPIAHHEFLLKNSLPKPYLYILSDADIIFLSDPRSDLEMQMTDVWSRGRERYLRPSNKARLLRKNPRYTNPDIRNLKELTAYMGKTRAYFFIKHQLSKLPEFGIYSDFVSIKSNICRDLINTWYLMFCDINKNGRKYMSGDQEILCSAITRMGLSCKTGDLNYIRHFQSGRKKNMTKS